MKSEAAKKKVMQDSNQLLMKMNDIFMGQDMNVVFTSLIRATANVTASSPDPKALNYAIEALTESHEAQKKRIQKTN